MDRGLEDALSITERRVLDALEPIFPQHTKQILLQSITHPSNAGDEGQLLQACIDDLLEMRTYQMSVEQRLEYISSDNEESSLGNLPDVGAHPTDRKSTPSRPLTIDEDSFSAFDGESHLPECDIQTRVDYVCAQVPDVDCKYARRLLLDHDAKTAFVVKLLKSRMGLYPKRKKGEERSGDGKVAKSDAASLPEATSTPSTAQKAGVKLVDDDWSVIEEDVILGAAKSTPDVLGSARKESQSSRDGSVVVIETPERSVISVREVSKEEEDFPVQITMIQPPVMRVGAAGGSADGMETIDLVTPTRQGRADDAAVTSREARGTLSPTGMNEYLAQHRGDVGANNKGEPHDHEARRRELEEHYVRLQRDLEHMTAAAREQSLPAVPAPQQESPPPLAAGPGITGVPGAAQAQTEGHPATLPTSQEYIIKESQEQICQLFPLVEPAYVMERLLACTCGQESHVMCVANQVLENNNYPRKQKTTSAATATTVASTDNTATAATSSETDVPSVSSSCVDYFECYDKPVSSAYRQQCAEIISNQFPRIPIKFVRRALGNFNYHYAATHKCLLQGLTSSGYKLNFAELQVKHFPGHKLYVYQVVETEGNVKIALGKEEVGFSLLKLGRRVSNCISFASKHFCPKLRQEVEFTINKRMQEIEVRDLELAETLNEREYADAGQGIECGCCYGDYPFEDMVQCADGHLFCGSCLQSYAKEAVYGQGKSSLSCMDGECEAVFLKSQLERCLASDMLAKYEDRCQEEALNLADISDLVRCPHCDFAAILDPDDKVMSCQNEACRKETCRYCKEEWEEHFGKKCQELEKKGETALRLQFEERMTMAKIRQCHKCKASFTKIDGCNKMTCRCGAKMCYICRKPDINYNHFCGHARDPGHGCTKCKACSLWTNPEEDDDRAVKEIQEEAGRARKEQGFEDEKLIGAPEEPPNKKKKKSDQQQNQPDRQGQNQPNRQGHHQHNRQGHHQPNRHGHHQPNRQGHHQPNRQGHHQPNRHGHQPYRHGHHQPNRPAHNPPYIGPNNQPHIAANNQPFIPYNNQANELNRPLMAQGYGPPNYQQMGPQYPENLANQYQDYGLYRN